MTVTVPDTYLPAVYAAGVAAAILFLLYATLHWPKTPKALVTDYPLATLPAVTAVIAGWCWVSEQPHTDTRTGLVVVSLAIATAFTGLWCFYHFITVVDRIHAD